MKKSDNIFLVGYMGCGKSTVAKLLAENMERTFLDLDIEIQRRSSQPIDKLFEKDESHFRMWEKRVLEEISSQRSQVIATGGGTPINPDNLQTMKRSGLVVYLNLSVDTLIARLQHDNSKRPLVAGKTKSELAAFVTDHFRQREHHYQQADIIVEATIPVTELQSVIENYSR